MITITSKLKISVLTASVLLLTPNLHAQILIGFNFSGYQNSGPAASSSNDISVNPSALVLPALSGLTNDNSYPSNYGVSPDAAATTLALAEANNDYIGFTITPSAGYTLNLTDLNFVAASFNHTTFLTLTDSSQNVLGSAAVDDSGGSGYQQNITLSLTSGGSINSATSFRLYDYGNVGPLTQQILLFNNGGATSFSIDGTAIASVPEPSTYVLVGLGALALFFFRRRLLIKAIF